MNFTISFRKRARDKIEALDLIEIIEMAKKYFGLTDEDVVNAVRDYRHYLYLVYWNRREGKRLSVIPTDRADKLWHAHLLFSENYRTFCESLVSEFVDHNPGLTAGSEQYLEAVAHTKLLHDRRGGDGFHPDYFSHVVVKQSRDKKTTSSENGDEMLHIHLAESDSGSDCGGCGD